MKLNLILSLALVSGATLLSGAALADSPAPLYGSCNPGYGNGAIERFRGAESAMIQWNSRYSAAPSGSWDEQYADQQRRAAGQAALNEILSFGSLSSYPASQVESFSQEMTSKYNAASSGSYTESVYRSAVEAGYNSYTILAVQELRCGSDQDYERPIQLGEIAAQKYNAASSGSRPEAAYRQVMQESWNVAREFLRNYFAANSYQDFRQFENLGVRFQQLYNAASSGSSREAFYRDAMAQAFDAAMNGFRQIRSRIDTNTLMSIEQEYSQRFNAAPSGSRMESYCRTIRDEARSELSSRLGGGYNPGNPYPPAPPAPYPPSPYPPAPPAPYPPAPYPPAPYPPAPPAPYPPSPYPPAPPAPYPPGHGPGGPGGPGWGHGPGPGGPGWGHGPRFGLN